MDINKQTHVGANIGTPSVKQTDGQDVKQVASKATASELSRQITNANILAAQEKVNLESGDKSMTLLYKAAVEAIDKELAPTLGANSTQKHADNNVDYSSEATAERIVSFATQFFPMHQERNSNMSLDEQLESFMGIIGGAIDQGFGEARDILKGLQVLQGDIESGVDSTYDFVQKGLQDFRDKIIPPKTPETAA